MSAVPVWITLFIPLGLFHPHAATDPSARLMEKMDTMGLIKICGWRAEEFPIQTADGYKLRIHRITSTRSNRSTRAVPVLLQHGMLCASDSWVLRGPRQDLAFKLAEAGYDVWLGNVRGNTYCKSHINMNSSMNPFWDYSFHEMGYYDVPAMIDRVLSVTGAPQLFYFGHSMGTTMFYVMASTRPEYNAKVRAMFSLAPVAYMAQFPEIYKLLSARRYEIWNAFRKQGIKEVWPRLPWLPGYEANLCRDGSPIQRICIEIFFAISGRDYKQLNKSMLPMVVEHLSSTNLKTLGHYAQNIASGRFQKFDYGPKRNKLVYGRSDAPDYDLKQITAPVSLHYSTNDLLSYEKDVLKLARELPNVIGVFKVPWKMFNHVDYLWGKDAYSLLYKDIMQLMAKL